MGWKQEAFAQRPKGSPLSPHVNGWCKSIKGKLVIIAGKVPHAVAMEKYHLKMAKIITASEAGTPLVPQVVKTVGKEVVTTPVQTAAKVVPSITVKQLQEKYMVHRLKECRRGKISSEGLAATEGETELLCEFLGEREISSLNSKDFTSYRNQIEATRRTSPYSITRNVIQVKAMFKWAVDEDVMLIVALPRYGKEFRMATDTEKTKHQGKMKRMHGKSMFDADEIQKILQAATAVERAMVLLGLNCAFGNKDVAELRIKAIDFSKGVIEYPRHKTGVERKVFLWPETVAAVKEAIPLRPVPKEEKYDGHVFLTPTGLPWVQSYLKPNGKVMRSNELTWPFKRLQERAGTYRDSSRGFYALRRTFATTAAQLGDKMTRDHVMGHRQPGMDPHYVLEVNDSLIQRLTDYVRSQFASALQQPGSGPELVKVGEYERPELDLT
jgi:integrase